MESDEERFKRISKVRQTAKTVNYSSLYGVGAKKLSRTAKISVKDAQLLLEAFWKINWAVRAVAQKQFTKELRNGELWVKNPVSGFWHNLRYEKDIWSTINQSTGVYCFDKWVALCKQKGVQVCMQFHDEQANPVVIGQEKQHEKILQGAIETLNGMIKLNVPLGIDVKFGINYAEVH